MSTTAQHLRRQAESPARRSGDEGRDLRLVEPQARRLPRPTGMLAVGLGIGLCAVVMLGLVLFHVVLAQRQIELDHLDARTAAATQQYQDLRLKVAQLEAPGRIVATAEGRLGMRPPSTVHYVSPPPARPAGAAPAPTSGGTAPAGDASWPSVKATLAGRP